jgi:hypothetical protein
MQARTLQALQLKQKKQTLCNDMQIEEAGGTHFPPLKLKPTAEFKQADSSAC